MTNKYTLDTPTLRDKDYLYQQYWGEGRSAQDIADEHDVSPNTVRRYMRQFGIPRRHAGDHCQGVDPTRMPWKYQWPEDAGTGWDIALTREDTGRDRVDYGRMTDD